MAATVEQQQPLWFRATIATLACIAYMGSASSLILLNKYILSNDGFSYPMALSTLGMGFSSIAAHVYCKVFGLNSEGAQISFYDFCTRFLPVGLFMAMSLYSGNLVYLFLTVAFVQMLKALSPAVTMLTLFAFQLEKPSLPLIGSVMVITCGIGISSFGEINFVLIGVLIMLLSILADALRLVLIQFLLTNRAMHPLEVLKFLAPACTIWLLLGTYLVEYPTMVEQQAFDKIQHRPWLYIAAAVMGFAVNSLCYSAIKLTSSLTIKVVSAGKDAFVVLFSVMVLHEAVSGMQVVGYSCSIFGFALYNYVQYRQAQAFDRSNGVVREKAAADEEALDGDDGDGDDGDDETSALLSVKTASAENKQGKGGSKPGTPKRGALSVLSVGGRGAKD